MVTRREPPPMIRFPTDDPAYEDTQEGGMFVRLVVDWDEHHTFMRCCGGQNYVHYGEVFIGTDKDDPYVEEFPDIIHKGALEYGYGASVERRILSIPYLATMTLGSTKWSGLHIASDHYWKASTCDLTADGMSLYRMVERMYEGAEIRLQTWLDT